MTFQETFQEWLHGPIEAWLRRDSMEVACTRVREDETTSYPQLMSSSMRDAQRDITGLFVSGEFGSGKNTALGRWEITEGDLSQPIECKRRFRPAE